MLKNVNADVNIVDREGSTALHRATSHGNMVVTKFLLEECKVDATIRNKVCVQLCFLHIIVADFFLSITSFSYSEATQQWKKLLLKN